MDISNFMTSFLSMLMTFFSFCFNTLDSITMFGFSLLDYCLAMIILPVGVSLFVAVTRNSGRELRSSYSRGESSKRENEE